MKLKLRTTRWHREEGGYALVAALLIMVLMTSVGMWALLTSSTESKLSGAIFEDHYNFFYAEQGVDRVLSHLHYLEQGLFSSVDGLGYSFQDTSTEALAPKLVLDEKPVVHLKERSSGLEPETNAAWKLTAYLDPEDYPDAVTRNLSRQVRLNVKVTSTTGFEKAFRATVKPRSVWDFAYFAQNFAPDQRGADSDYGVCADPSNDWYNCQVVFHEGDFVTGDVYVRNADKRFDDAHLFFRGSPTVAGRVYWRSHKRFDLGTWSGAAGYNNSPFQTAGGVNNTAPPTNLNGVQQYAKPVGLPDAENFFSQDAGWYAANADVYLQRPATGYAYKMIFRNDINTTNTALDGCREEGRVASAITENLNDKAISCPTHKGTFMLYRVPHDNASNDAGVERRKNLFGNSMRKRHIEMTQVDTGYAAPAEIYSSSASWAAKVVGGCTSERNNTSSNFSYGPYDPYDIDTSLMGGPFTFFEVPSQGGSSCGGGSYSGIIFVEGDLYLSGIVDGKVTIVVAGDVIIDHEIEYEQDPYTGVNSANYSSPNDFDLLNVIALGDIVIPNTYPHRYATEWYWVFDDDFSDPPLDAAYLTEDELRKVRYQPVAEFDEHNAMVGYDDGHEDIHAVLVSYGLQQCTGTGGTLDCDIASASTYDEEIQDFFVGVYANPRTEDGHPHGKPYDAHAYGGATYKRLGNDSGNLRIVGALIQNYPGRFGYDYYDLESTSSGDGSYANSNCTGNSGSCNFIGHHLNLARDPHLDYTTPAFPRGAGANYFIPYGYASYDIVSWEQINPASIDGSYGETW